MSVDKSHKCLKTLTCIGCPMGCELTVTLADGKVISVKGNNCIKGSIYAQKECINPTRILTSTVAVERSDSEGYYSEGGNPEKKYLVLSVKTETDIPKEKLLECVELLKAVKVTPPIKLGDIIVHNIANTGVNIVATKNL
jgi:CxxC motif-containing protein